MDKKSINIGIPAFNEEDSLRKCISAIEEATKNINNRIKTYICLNGCKDKTEEVANRCRKEFLNLNITVLKSKIGKLLAQKEIIKNISSNNEYVMFIDADAEIEKNALKIIINELNKHRDLIVVGSFPVAKKYIGFNPWKKILDKILNIRSRHPKSEISKLNVKEYHLHAIKDPQKINTSKIHELKSKIFFHGRLFVLRSKKYWKMPDLKKGIVGDDSFLPDFLIHKYGKNKIRIRYDAIVYYNPFTSLIKHYKTYKRIFFDLQNLRKGYPEFKDIRDHSILILDKNYISHQKFRTRMAFYMFELIRNIEKKFFKLSLNKNPFEIWENTKK